jgi:hypothetical protein
MFDGPGGQTTDGTGGAWHSSQNFTMAPMSADSNVAGTLKRGEGLGNRYDSFRQAGKNLVSSNWDKAKQANSDAAHLHELNFPVGREQGFTDGHIVVGDLVLGGIAREAKGDLGFHVAELAANLPVGSNLIGYITIHPNADFEKKVVGHDIGVVNNWYGIQTKVYYQAPRSITNWGRYDAGPPKVIDN